MGYNVFICSFFVFVVLSSIFAANLSISTPVTVLIVIIELIIGTILFARHIFKECIKMEETYFLEAIRIEGDKIEIATIKYKGDKIENAIGYEGDKIENAIENLKVTNSY